MDITKRTILVAGASGLIGQAIVKCFSRAGCNNLLVPSRSQLDLENYSQVVSYFESKKPDIVVFAAGAVGGILHNKLRPVELLSRNLALQMNVALAADIVDVSRVVFFGSSCMYPKECIQPMAESMLWTGKLEPSSLSYATSKIAGFQLGFSYNQQQGKERFLCVIPNSVYGPGDDFDPQSGHVLSSLISKFHAAKIQSAEHVTLWGTGNPKREFVFCEDIAAAVLFLLENDVATSTEPINVGSGCEVSISELAKKVATVVGFNGEIRWQIDKPDGAKRKLLDSSRINALGWKAKTNLTDGIRDTYAWYLQNS